jgi:hypothetical protein
LTAVSERAAQEDGAMEDRGGMNHYPQEKRINIDPLGQFHGSSSRGENPRQQGSCTSRKAKVCGQTDFP